MRLSPIRWTPECVLRVKEFFSSGLWRMDPAEGPAWRRGVVRLLRALASAAAEFLKDQCMLRASALTFYTLMSIVPLLAVVFGIAQGFGLEKLLEKELMERMAGQEQALDRILAFSRKLLENTQGGLMAGVGVAVMLWAALKAIGQIESALNAIWDVPAPRGWVRKVTDYLAIMLTAPVLLIGSGSATIFIRTQIDQIANLFNMTGVVAPLATAALNLGPVLLMWTLFTLIYMAMPNTRVPFGTAAAGGIFGGSLFLLVQGLYISFQVGVASNNAVYGSFAALPLFLVWVQTSWTLVLLGAEFGYAFEHADRYTGPTGCPALSPAGKKHVGLILTHRLVRDFAAGRPAPTTAVLAGELKLPQRLVETLIEDLCAGGVLVELRRPDSAKRVFQPAADIRGLSMDRVLLALDRAGGTEYRGPSMDPGPDRLAAALEEFQHGAAQSPSNRLLIEL